MGYFGIWVIRVANLYAKVPHFGGGRLLWYIGHTSGKSIREIPHIGGARFLWYIGPTSGKSIGKGPTFRRW